MRPSGPAGRRRKASRGSGGAARALAPWRKAQVEEADGYARLRQAAAAAGAARADPDRSAVRGADEFAQLWRRRRATAYRRFATGIILVWYPIKSQGAAEAFVRRGAGGRHRQGAACEIAMEADAGRLCRAGLLVLNPPYGFDGAMMEILALLAPRLAAQTRMDWVAGEA